MHCPVIPFSISFVSTAAIILPMNAKITRKILNQVKKKAGEETRTLDPQLGRLMLYQLSYARIIFCSSSA